jgi:hypothetical protein
MAISGANVKVAHGTWRPTPAGTPEHYTGICQRCGGKFPAIRLTLKRLPFGRGEEWRCQGAGTRDCLTAKAGE